MTELRFETYTMPAALLGPDNPLPDLRTPSDIRGPIAASPSIPEEDRRYFGYGRVPGCLPYRLQDNYERMKTPHAFQAAVLENDILRATFLLEMGGRLWSLYHKPARRELLDVNPVFQPANLALRNAWFSGGIEWNFGVIGHSPFTCSPMFVARLRAEDGMPVLRMYEWERIRQIAYQMDFYLPDGSPVLLVQGRFTNPHPHEVPVYWWSNMAVPETARTRVLVPAETALTSGYARGIDQVPVPYDNGVDVTYPRNIPHSMDFFFRIPDDQRHWETALDEDGRGLVETSTVRLRGRKAFVWGMGAGGRHWQEFLAAPGQAYLEIQAGLARTQFECVPMPPAAEWSWSEAFGLMEADPSVAHGTDWTAARREVERRLNALFAPEAQAEEYARGATIANLPVEEIIQRGSGWGALEQRRRAITGEKPGFPEALVFDETSLGDEQAPWLDLLLRGAFPTREVSDDPGAWMIQSEWRQLLEDALGQGRGDHWLSWLHLGVMRFAHGDAEGAREAWEQSLERERSSWALRNLAVLAKHEKRLADAADLWLGAHQCMPAQRQIVIECGSALLAAERPQDWSGLLETLPDDLRNLGRIRYLEAQAALATGDFATTERILRDELVIPDLREHEVSLSDLWFSLQEKRVSQAEAIPIDEELKKRVRREFPPPSHLDFRMRFEGTR